MTGAATLEAHGGVGDDELSGTQNAHRASPTTLATEAGDSGVRVRAMSLTGALARALRRTPTPGPEVAPPARTPGEHEIIERLDRVGAEVVAARAELDALHRRTRVTQELVARQYERAQDWPGKLEAIRQSAGYEAPYEPEPLITATIPTYNRAGLLCERALASLRRQTYENWEAVVVGDACTDDTEECVRAIGDPRIRFENLPFRGPYPEDPEERWKMAGVFAANRCAELASGAWLAALDDDDEWDDDHLEQLLAHAQSTHAEIAYGQWRQRDSGNGRLIDHTFGTWPLTDEQFAFPCSIIHSGLRALPFDPDARLSGEPGDRNRVRRLWDAGVRFAFLERPVSTVWFTPRFDEAAGRVAWLIDKVGYEDEDASRRSS